MTKVIYCDKQDCIFHSDRDEYDLSYLCRLDHIRIKDERCEDYISIEQFKERRADEHNTERH